jgi:hypothetical protein
MLDAERTGAMYVFAEPHFGDIDLNRSRVDDRRPTRA